MFLHKSYALDKKYSKSSSFITICPDNIKILKALKSREVHASLPIFKFAFMGKFLQLYRFVT